MSNAPDSPIQLDGQLLLADPSLRDGIFHKSVVFLSEHNLEDGAYGLILNHPTEQTVGDLLPSNEFQELNNIRVYLGGPIGQEHLTFAAFTSTQKQVRLKTRIPASEAIKRSQQPGTLIRAFAGYSGWSSGQLENELRHNSWISTNANQELLSLDHDKNLWGRLLRGISPYHQILAEAPDDIFSN
ncbi:YqgE/AlgH family protein [Verrucomicrobiaceae bacterium N1E253]|uniref:YqgE/AlgH family protein n=1 Tax=Oceaniferula marina TaxID=2748318 RepID=A0A851GLH2_9BACT|nr:YqgE/AlgH family protein [Oceaniferula marina]NWK56015.1 YqgE/AlgH family protein [Oceaniferula marina]